MGLGLAIELGQRGVRCILIEKHGTPQPIPKGQNLTQRTMEHFHFWAAEQPLRAARTIPVEHGIGGMTSYGTLLGSYRYDWLQRELVRPFYFTDNERLPQYATEAVLRHRLSQIPNVETFFGWTVEALTQNDSGVDVQIVAARDGGRRMLHADYAVGCDGSRSLVREAVGIGQTRADHDRTMVLLVFRSVGLHGLLAQFPRKSFFNVLRPELQGYWQFFGRVDLGTTWFFHAPVPSGTSSENFDFPAYLHNAVGAAFDVELLHVGFWDLRFAVANTYRCGRVFIAGDACHSHPPYGGDGVNTGLEDAVNLGWKLAACLRGWGGPGLLDSYDEERRPVFESTARDFIDKAIRSDRDFLERFDPAIDRVAFEREWTDRSSGARTEVQAFEPNYEGSSIVWGPLGTRCSAIGSHRRMARAGHHFTPCRLSSGRDAFEELGEGFTLFDLASDSHSVAALRNVAEHLRVPLRVVAVSDPVASEFYGQSLVLVRPDQFVAWAASGPVADAHSILGRVVGR